MTRRSEPAKRAEPLPDPITRAARVGTYRRSMEPREEVDPVRERFIDALWAAREQAARVGRIARGEE